MDSLGQRRTYYSRAISGPQRYKRDKKKACMHTAALHAPSRVRQPQWSWPLYPSSLGAKSKILWGIIVLMITVPLSSLRSILFEGTSCRTVTTVQWTCTAAGNFGKHLLSNSNVKFDHRSHIKARNHKEAEVKISSLFFLKIKEIHWWPNHLEISQMSLWQFRYSKFVVWYRHSYACACKRQKHNRTKTLHFHLDK